MEMAGSSNALDVSAPTQDLKYIQALTINVSNFVSVKLSGRSNYKIWKAQMLCLIQSQLLLHIIDAENQFPVDKGIHMIAQYDKLVKGWIFGSVNEKVLNDLVDSGTAQEVWMKLGSLFNLPVSDTEGDSSNEPDVSARDVAPVVSAMREDLKYLQALNVDVSNFVSEKLVGKTNYYTWKTDMLFLIESHELLHIIHAEARFPWDKADPKTQKYDSLVRGWILSNMNDNQRDIYRMYRSVQLIWRKLESTFSYQSKPSYIYIEDSEDDSSNETEDLIYMQLKSNVNIYDFVSVKLSGRSNYNIWKDQMLRLLQSNSLLHIIDEEAPSQQDKDDPMTQKYDSLVRGWILGTMNDEERHKFRIYRSVKMMWSRVKSTFDETEDLIYMEESNVNVSNFISVKLSYLGNYTIWRAQMLYLLESQNLIDIIFYEYYLDEEYLDEEYKYKYEELVKSWIFRTMDDELLKDFPADDYFSDKAKDVWEKLESRFAYGYSRPEPIDSALPQDLKYTQASNVNVSNFVSMKLSGSLNYRIWKVQMLCLIESQKLLHIIYNEERYKVDKYDALVKGWILRTMNEQLLNNFKYIEVIFDFNYSAKKVWKKLELAFNPPKDPQEAQFRIEFIKDDTEAITPDLEGGSIKGELYVAAAQGWWRKAKSILVNSRGAATEAIAADGNTILHVAVKMGHNYFVEELLEFLENGEDIEKKNDKGQTALHIAAIVGNTHAAQLLVQKRNQLLVIEDSDGNLPLDLSSEIKNLNTYQYLLKSTPSNSDGKYSYYKHKPALLAAVYSKQYDLAEELLEKISFDFDSVKDILMAMTITFPADLGFMETFISPSFQNVCRKIAVRGSLLFHPERCVASVSNIFNNTCCSWVGKNSMILLVLASTLYPIHQLICLFILMLHLSFSLLYLLLWKVLTVTVRPIKNIEMKKKRYQKAKTILRMVCEKMSPHDNYSDELFEAVRLDKYEVVDEILFRLPATINCKDEDGYNIIQSTILNRAEKVYNLIYHIVDQFAKSYGEVLDSSMNNLGHLAGRLGPSFVLDRTTGPALQLQRELLWFEEVENLVLPLQSMEKNIYNETPAMVFKREHQDLLKEGEIWMKATAQSCSITAALNVTVVFAAAITVPGGNHQESGTPVLESELAFNIFAVCNAFSLFIGAAALLLFLWIIVAPFSQKDFLVRLPRRLLYGLLALFLSTTAMVVAFGAILFLVFCDKNLSMLVPICLLAILPISISITIKVPLLLELIWSLYSPIFGKQSYPEYCKTNRKNTILTKAR